MAGRGKRGSQFKCGVANLRFRTIFWRPRISARCLRRLSKWLSSQGCKSLEEFSVGSGADEIDLISFKLINQKKIATDMALAVIGPIALEGMIHPFQAQWCVIRDQ